MTRPLQRSRLLCASLLATVACTVGRPAPADEKIPAGTGAPCFLVFPITSDEEGLGQRVRLMLRRKAKRLGAIVYDPASVREALAGEAPTVDAPATTIARLARDRFKADIAVVGHVGGKQPYEIRLVAVYTDDLRKPRTLERKYSCGHHQRIPPEMAKAAREILGLPEAADSLAALRRDPHAERRWRDGPNLVKNPGFEEGNAAGDGPAHWQALEPQMAWVANPDGPGKVLKFDVNADAAATYGLDYYSDWIPIEPGAAYRFSCRLKTLGPAAKIFLKGYHPFPATDGRPAQRRETYRRQVHPGGERGKWQIVVADFIPEAARPKHAPTFLKVDLYAYLNAGVVYWDDVVLKKIADPRKSAGAPKRPAPSAEPPPQEAKGG